MVFFASPQETLYSILASILYFVSVWLCVNGAENNDDSTPFIVAAVSDYSLYQHILFIVVVIATYYKSWQMLRHFYFSQILHKEVKT